MLHHYVDQLQLLQNNRTTSDTAKHQESSSVASPLLVDSDNDEEIQQPNDNVF